jgi:flagellar hook protein FlgE
MTFEIALTGLKAASADLEIISNNIANAATIGFKRSGITFGDVYSSTHLGSTGNATGQGVRVTNISQEFAQGDVTYTENQLDMSIAGSGFFRLNDNGAIVYSRAGSFSLDREGFIVNGLGHRLTGFPADEQGRITPISADLRLNAIDSSPNQTSDMSLQINLDSKSLIPEPFDPGNVETYNNSTSVTVYDSLGSSFLSTLYFRKTSDSTWNVHTYIGDEEIGTPGGDELTFNSEGMLDTINGNPASQGFDTSYVRSADSPDMQIDINITFEGSTQYDSTFSVTSVNQNGYNAGRLNDFDISTDGVIYGQYSNGQSRELGQLTLTDFRNPKGLQQVGNTGWIETFGSGVATTGTPGTASLGMIQSSSLEESNIDLTQELVKMIATQRNFQANAQVISASDTLTQTVINIRR